MAAFPLLAFTGTTYGCKFSASRLFMNLIVDMIMFVIRIACNKTSLLQTKLPGISEFWARASIWKITHRSVQNKLQIKALGHLMEQTKLLWHRFLLK